MIFGLFGNLSSGKTITSIMLIDNYFKNQPVISNIKLNFDNAITLSIEKLYDYAINNPEYFLNKILLVDEIHNIVDARRSSSSLNTKFTLFLTQLGKLDCTLFFTSQILSSQVDLRLRNLCDVFIFCERVLENPTDVFNIKRITKDKIYIKCLMYIKVMSGLDYKRFKFIYDPSQYFNSYDTREIVLIDREKYLVK